MRRSKGISRDAIMPLIEMVLDHSDKWVHYKQITEFVSQTLLPEINLGDAYANPSASIYGMTLELIKAHPARFHMMPGGFFANRIVPQTKVEAPERKVYVTQKRVVEERRKSHAMCGDCKHISSTDVQLYNKQGMCMNDASERDFVRFTTPGCPGFTLRTQAQLNDDANRYRVALYIISKMREKKVEGKEK